MAPLRILIVSIGLSIAQCSSAQPSSANPTQNVFPDDVTQFVMRRDLCDHLRGEIPDAPDADFIKRVNESCLGTDGQLERLKQKYRSNLFVTSKISVFEPHVEAK